MIRGQLEHVLDSYYHYDDEGNYSLLEDQCFMDEEPTHVVKDPHSDDTATLSQLFSIK